MKHLAWILSALSLPLGQAAAYLVTPDGTPAPGSTEDCSYWIAYIEYATCELIEEVYQITAAEFEEWVSDDCFLPSESPVLTLHRTRS